MQKAERPKQPPTRNLDHHSPTAEPAFLGAEAEMSAQQVML